MFLLSLGLILSHGLNFPLAIDRCEVYEESYKIRCFNDAQQKYCVYTTNECVGRTNSGKGPEKSELKFFLFFPISTKILHLSKSNRTFFGQKLNIKGVGAMFVKWLDTVQVLLFENCISNVIKSAYRTRAIITRS